MKRIRECITFRPKWTIVKFRSKSQALLDKLHDLLHYEGLSVDEAARKVDLRPYQTLQFTGNLMLNEGINTLWTLVCGGTATPYNNTNARIGVGDGTATESPTQTGLQGVNKAFKGMDAGYPTFGSAQKATWRATFGATEANFTWNEITVVNGPDDTAMNLNRKVQAMGTKAAGSVWVATLEITAS